jgi:hypothetical protein
MTLSADSSGHYKDQKTKARCFGFYLSPPTFASPYCLFKIEFKSD